MYLVAILVAFSQVSFFSFFVIVNPQLLCYFPFRILGFFFSSCLGLFSTGMRFDSSSVIFLPDSNFQMCGSRMETVLLSGKNRIMVHAQIGANAETNCCCCGLAPRRDALGALHCAWDPSVRVHAECLWSGGERDVPSALLQSLPILV